MPHLAIYILCHNRPEDALRAIRSVLAQSDNDFTLTLSDNSSNDEVQNMVQAEFPDLHYVRRVPMLSALEHFNRCITESDGAYFCLFHDDDLMGVDFVKEVKLAIASYPQAIAIGCNAHIETQGSLQPGTSFRSSSRYEYIRSARDLASRYFARYQSGIAPFPGYVYQKMGVGTIRFHSDEGKYSDVAWLLRLREQGPMVWISRPLITYRLHGENDGLTESRRDRLRFLAFLKKHRSNLGENLLKDYRCSFVYKPIAKSPLNTSKTRLKIAQRFLRHYRFTRHTRLDTYMALVRRARVKWAQQK